MDDDAANADAEDDGVDGSSAETPIDANAENFLDYEFNDWSGQSRALLDSMLGKEDVPHTWRGATLLIPLDSEEITDALIEVVNQTATAGLDPERGRAVYEVGTWSAALQTSLAETLDIAEIDFEWDQDGDLVIYLDDEERVDEILEAMPDPNDPDAVDADGVDVQDVLSSLWSSTKKLAKRPADADAVLAAVAAGNQLEKIGLPFGFEAAVWRDIVGKSLALRDAFESDDPEDHLTDDEIQEGCRQLSRQIRAFVA